MLPALTLADAAGPAVTVATKVWVNDVPETVAVSDTGPPDGMTCGIVHEVEAVPSVPLTLLVGFTLPALAENVTFWKASPSLF